MKKTTKKKKSSYSYDLGGPASINPPKKDYTLPALPTYPTTVETYDRNIDVAGKILPKGQIDPDFMKRSLDLPQEPRSSDLKLRSLITSGILAFDAMLPDEPQPSSIVRPLESYNANAYGTGSQAIAKNGKKIKKADTGDILAGDPTPEEQYYQASARLAYYKERLNSKLKKKNPQGFGDYFKGLVDLRRSGKTTDAEKYVQESQYNDYLTPEEVRGELGEDDYNEYLNSLKAVNTYNIQQGKQPLYGNIEGENDITKLNYGRRFASLQITPSLAVSNREGTRNYDRSYTYDPKNRKVDFKESGDVSLRPSYVSAPNDVASNYEFGGSVKKAKVEVLWGGKADMASYNPYDGGTMEFKGDSHEQGGIGVSFGGKKVEVEGDETAFKDEDGDLHIMGNMYVPGTNKKFKTVSKMLATEEKKVGKQSLKAGKLISEVGDPEDSFESLKMNSAKGIQIGSQMKMKNISETKQAMAHLQKAMLDASARAKVDPTEMSKAKKGYTLPMYDEGGDPEKKSVAQRHNNPGNLKYKTWMKKYGAVPGEKSTDGGNFAKFPDLVKGKEAMVALLKDKTYQGKTVYDAINLWTNKSPYKSIPKSIKDKQISSLNPEEFQSLLDTITKGEDSKLYNFQQPNKNPNASVPHVDVDLPEIFLTPEEQEKRKYGQPESPGLEDFDVRDRKSLPSNIEPLNIAQVAPELYTLATNRVEPVQMQRYTPDLYTPYQVSFQDQLDENQATFRALEQDLSSNPEALSILAAQKYQANQAIKGSEFRTNQGITADVINKNVGLLNDAELKNLQIADTQFVRQDVAKSKTRAQDMVAVNSIASKYLQNRLENRRLAAYENLYDFRFEDTDKDGIAETSTYMGPEASFDFSGMGDESTSRNQRMRQEFDGSGKLKKTQITTPSQQDTQKKDEELKKIRDYNFRKNMLPIGNAGIGGIFKEYYKKRR
jgi:hypothetical protein